MDTKEIRQLAVAGARAEIKRLQAFLAEAEGTSVEQETNNRPTTKRKGRQPLTPEQREAMSRRMKAMWAAKRKRKGA
jgi:hypothetical protein